MLLWPARGRLCVKAAMYRQRGEVDSAGIAAELTAVIVAVTDGEPRVLTIEHGEALPAGPFEPGHRSLQAGLRAWVETQTRHPLGYVEQLYTFADLDRKKEARDRAVSVSYLGLTREAPAGSGWDASWTPWYRFFPWEDMRCVRPTLSDTVLGPALLDWAASANDPAIARARTRRAEINFGLGPGRPKPRPLPGPGRAGPEFTLVWGGKRGKKGWVRRRYGLWGKPGLVGNPPPPAAPPPRAARGKPMQHDHRRILATGIAR